jgi:putative transposase
VNERSDLKSRFEWQTGYAAFTVSQSQVGVVRGYIQRQKEQHANRSFRDEFIELLRRHQVSFEMEYVFQEEYAG